MSSSSVADRGLRRLHGSHTSFLPLSLPLVLLFYVALCSMFKTNLFPSIDPRTVHEFRCGFLGKIYVPLKPSPCLSVSPSTWEANLRLKTAQPPSDHEGPWSRKGVEDTVAALLPISQQKKSHRTNNTGRFHSWVTVYLNSTFSHFPLWKRELIPPCLSYRREWPFFWAELLRSLCFLV